MNRRNTVLEIKMLLVNEYSSISKFVVLIVLLARLFSLPYIGAEIPESQRKSVERNQIMKKAGSKKKSHFAGKSKKDE